jgi:hypothetical protein
MINLINQEQEKIIEYLEGLGYSAIPYKSIIKTERHYGKYKSYPHAIRTLEQAKAFVLYDRHDCE